MPAAIKPQTITLTIDAEENLLGSILIDGSTGKREALDCVMRIVSTLDFLREQHRRLYGAMLRCAATDQLSVALALEQANDLQKGDIPLMSYCISLTIGLDYETYARQVKTLANERAGAAPVTKPGFRGGV